MSLKFKTNIVFPGSPRTELSKIEMYFLLMVSSSSKSPGQFNSCAHCLVETPLWMQLIIFLRFVSIYWIQTNRKRYPTIHSVRGLDGNWERNILNVDNTQLVDFRLFLVHSNNCIVILSAYLNESMISDIRHCTCTHLEHILNSGCVFTWLSLNIFVPSLNISMAISLAISVTLRTSL